MLKKIKKKHNSQQISNNTFFCEAPIANIFVGTRHFNIACNNNNKKKTMELRNIDRFFQDVKTLLDSFGWLVGWLVV